MGPKLLSPCDHCYFQCLAIYHTDYRSCFTFRPCKIKCDKKVLDHYQSCSRCQIRSQNFSWYPYSPSPLHYPPLMTNFHLKMQTPTYLHHCCTFILYTSWPQLKMVLKHLSLTHSTSILFYRACFVSSGNSLVRSLHMYQCSWILICWSNQSPPISISSPFQKPQQVFTQSYYLNHNNKDMRLVAVSEAEQGSRN